MAVPPQNVIHSKFSEKERFANFGNALTRIHARGFRCHQNTFLEVRHPITAFCGLNGTGKSTLLQLIASAYQPLVKGGGASFRISDFLIVGTLDPYPFTPDASVIFEFAAPDRKTIQRTLSRSVKRSGWNGYPARPRRSILFSGVGHYLPKIEDRDFIVNFASHVSVTKTEPVPQVVMDWVSRILTTSYDSAVTKGVQYVAHNRLRSNRVVSVARHGTEYSEAHMGFGEARTQYLVGVLEAMPEQSLILIEEPETSLHPSAQEELGNYLVDVVNRKNHQVFLTTHSTALLSTLHSEAIVYLKRDEIGVKPKRGYSAGQVGGLLSDGRSKALHVLVEDDCAEAILREMIRHADPDFLCAVELRPAGDTRAVLDSVRAMAGAGMLVVGVRDGDTGETTEPNMFRLPGTLPPEKELFNSDAVALHVSQQYDLNWANFCAGLKGIDHHQWLSRLARSINMTREGVLMELARVYARTLPENIVVALVDQLKNTAAKR